MDSHYYTAPNRSARQGVCVVIIGKRGGALLNKLNSAISVERTFIEEPFPLEKTAGTLRKLCRQYATPDKFKQSFVEIGNVFFNTKHLINAFEAVGSKARGYLASVPDIFYGRPYMIIEPVGFEYGKAVHAILLQSGRCGG